MGYRDTAGLHLLPLQGSGNAFVPSALYAIEREFITEDVVRALPSKDDQAALAEKRSNVLHAARIKHREAGTQADEVNVYIGDDAIGRYLQQPDEGYFIKSPKSFLGATGLSSEAIGFFEDVVSWMMQDLVARAEKTTGMPVRQTVIGRPVNFQGANAAQSNQQAIEILTTAAGRAGFTDVEFMVEPVAAGLAFEQTLLSDQRVLVVDIGGGTSDCALLQMGPGHREKFDRNSDVLGHAGERIGGNDLDIQLAYSELMPHFGLGTRLKSGLRMPQHPFWLAVAVNDVNMQTEFYKPSTLRELRQLDLDCVERQLFGRLLKLREYYQNYQLVRCAELAKIELSEAQEARMELEFIESGLYVQTSQQTFCDATTAVVDQMMSLVKEAIAQAGSAPDQVFITGGSAKSPMIRRAVQEQLGAVPIHDGDDFGSVATGLGQWASVVYR